MGKTLAKARKKAAAVAAVGLTNASHDKGAKNAGHLTALVSEAFDKQKWERAEQLLKSMVQNSCVPKLGAVQRWVRSADLSGNEAWSARLLAAILEASASTATKADGTEFAKRYDYNDDSTENGNGNGQASKSVRLNENGSKKKVRPNDGKQPAPLTATDGFLPIRRFPAWVPPAAATWTPPSPLDLGYTEEEAKSGTLGSFRCPRCGGGVCKSSDVTDAPELRRSIVEDSGTGAIIPYEWFYGQEGESGTGKDASHVDEKGEVDYLSCFRVVPLGAPQGKGREGRRATKAGTPLEKRVVLSGGADDAASGSEDASDEDAEGKERDSSAATSAREKAGLKSKGGKEDESDEKGEEVEEGGKKEEKDGDGILIEGGLEKDDHEKEQEGGQKGKENEEKISSSEGKSGFLLPNLAQELVMVASAPGTIQFDLLSSEYGACKCRRRTASVARPACDDAKGPMDGSSSEKKAADGEEAGAAKTEAGAAAEFESPALHPMDLDELRAKAVTRVPVPFVPGAFVLTGVLSREECRQIVAAAEAIGYTLDPDYTFQQQQQQVEQIGGGADSGRAVGGLSAARSGAAGQGERGAAGLVWLADAALQGPIWKRVRKLLPQELAGEKLAGLNCRWRLYRYDKGGVYRPHVDGAWPGSGLSPDGQYVFDDFGNRWSRLTFLVYLNDDFEGGSTTFYTPATQSNPSSLSSSSSSSSTTTSFLEARGVCPCVGNVMVFPHGDTLGCLVHEGSVVTRGAKYVIRTEVLYEKRANNGAQRQEAEGPAKQSFRNTSEGGREKKGHGASMFEKKLKRRR